jgi:predicted membrane protein
MAKEKNVKERVNKGRQEVGKIKKGMSTALAYLPYILIDISAVIAIGLITLIAFDFDWDYIWSWNFLITSITLVIIYIMAHWSVWVSYLKSMRRNKENIEIKEDKEDDIKAVTNTTEWYNNKKDFINFRNEEKKKEAWIILVQNALTKLRNNAKDKDIEIEALGITDFQREHLAEGELLDIEADIDKRKQDCHYLIIKKELEEQLTDEWIAQNLSKMNHDYDKIDSQFIETGHLFKGQAKSKTNPKGKYAKDTMPMRLVMLLITVFITAFTTDLAMSQFTKDAWFLFVFRMMLLLANVVMALVYAETFYVDVDVFNLDSRVSIKNEFKVWGLEKGLYGNKKEE